MHTAGWAEAGGPKNEPGGGESLEGSEASELSCRFDSELRQPCVEVPPPIFCGGLGSPISRCGAAEFERFGCFGPGEHLGCDGAECSGVVWFAAVDLRVGNGSAHGP